MATDERNPELDAWVQVGVDKGWAARAGHYAYDGVTWVPTLVLQTPAVIALVMAAGSRCVSEDQEPHHE